GASGRPSPRCRQPGGISGRLRSALPPIRRAGRAAHPGGRQGLRARSLGPVRLHRAARGMGRHQAAGIEGSGDRAARRADLPDGSGGGSPVKRIAVIPGDGIGPEVIREAVEVVRALRVPVELHEHDYAAQPWLAGRGGIEDERFADFAEHYAAILFGAVGDPRIPDLAHGRQILLGLRTRLDLYINLRPARLYDERLCPLKDKRAVDVDFVVFRENTEGLYAGLGGVFKRGTPDEVAIEASLSTRKGVER